MFLYKGHSGLATIYISWMVAETKSSCKICNVRKDSAVILDSLRNFTDNVEGKWGDHIEYIRDINDGENTQKGLNILVAIGFSVDINDNKYRTIVR